MKTAYLAVIAITACSGNHAPQLVPINDQTAVVGVELSLEIRASDKEGDAIKFDFDAPMIADIKKRMHPATLVSYSGGVAVFRWTPSAKDRGDTAYKFDFSASDGKKTSTETVNITVKDSGGAGPVFRQPLGGGTVLDLSKQTCVQVPVVVDDASATSATIADEPPRIPGATITPKTAFSANWKWCPTATQRSGSQDQYQLLLSADDGASAKVKRAPYLIVLRHSGGECPGQAPVIMHTAPGPQMTVQDITLTATITDDKGIKGVPIVYYSTTAPTSHEDVFGWTPIAQMTRTAGDAKSGTYEATLPNPVANQAVGSSATLYYVISATDADDPVGGCNHTVDLPTDDVFSVMVTNSGDDTPVAICSTCSTDVACGTGEYCSYIVAGSTNCTNECTKDSDCVDSTFFCSSAPLPSVGKDPATGEGSHMARYCIPISGTCGTGGPSTDCVDDYLAPNQGMTAIANPAAADLKPGSYTNLIFCPTGFYSGADDWFGVSVSASDALTATISGAGLQDLDLEIVDAGGNTIKYSSSPGDVESTCISGQSGKVYVHVYPYPFGFSFYEQDIYDLTVTTQAGGCP